MSLFAAVVRALLLRDLLYLAYTMLLVLREPIAYGYIRRFLPALLHFELQFVLRSEPACCLYLLVMSLSAEKVVPRCGRRKSLLVSVELLVRMVCSMLCQDLQLYAKRN